MYTLLNPRRPRAANETVLCVHASAATGRSWDTPMAPLRERYDVLTPDRLGYAVDAHWAAGTPTSFDAEAAHLAPWLDAAPRGVHLVGHSFGGGVALQLALRHPERVLSLTLYEPVRFALLFGAAATEDAGQAIVGIGRTIGLWVLSGRHRDAAALFVDYWSGEGAWQAMDARRQDAVVRCMPKVRAEFEAAFSDVTPLAAYQSLEMPVRLVVGTESPAATRPIAELLADCLPCGALSVLEGAGHMGPQTHAPQFAAIVAEALHRPSQPLAA